MRSFTVSKKTITAMRVFAVKLMERHALPARKLILPMEIEKQYICLMIHEIEIYENPCEISWKIFIFFISEGLEQSMLVTQFANLDKYSSRKIVRVSLSPSFFFLLNRVQKPNVAWFSDEMFADESDYDNTITILSGCFLGWHRCTILPMRSWLEP